MNAGEDFDEETALEWAAEEWKAHALVSKGGEGAHVLCCSLLMKSESLDRPDLKTSLDFAGRIWLIGM